MKSNKLRSILSIVLVLYTLILLLPAYTASASSIGTCTCNETITLDSSTYPQSKHNYANNTNDTQVFSYPNATSLTVTFSASTETESDYDFIYLYDGSGVQIGKYSGTAAANKTITIEGDSFSVKLTSDNRTQKYGYSFSSIVAEISYPHIEIAAVAATCTQPGQTAGSKCSKCGSYVQVPTPTDALGHLWSPVTYTWSEDHSTCTASRTCIRSVLTSFENSQFNGSVDDLLDNPTLLGEAFQEFCEQNNLDTTDQEALKNALVLYLAQQAAPASDDTCNEAEEAFATVSSTEDFAPTCTEDGSRTFTATFEVDWAETQTKTVTIPAKGHANVTYNYAGGQIGFTNAGIAALKQSTFVQKLGAAETLRKVAFCCNEAERMSQGIFQNIFAHEEFRQFLASILGVDPSLPAEDLMRNIQDILNDPEVTEDQINANAAFLYVANRVSSMSQEEITQFLCQTDKYSTIRAHSDDNDLCCDALVEGSLVYGMYVAYAHHKNDDSLIEHTDSIITPIEYSDCSAYIEFIKNEQGGKDLNAFLAALEIANSSVRNAMEIGNNEAVKHLLINGLANGELVGVVQDALNSYSHTCADCETALTDHVEITIPGTAPSCTTPGLTEGSKCLLCDQILVAQAEIDAIAHKNKVHHEKVDATCVATGTIEYWSCPDCSKNFSDEACTAEVMDLTIAIDNSNHVNKTEHAQQDATCVDKGYTAGTYCEDCENWVSGHEEIPVTNTHSWNDGDETTAPTCTATGVMTYTCTVCNATKAETIPATGEHTYKDGVCTACGAEEPVDTNEPVPTTNITMVGYQVGLIEPWFLRINTLIQNAAGENIDPNTFTDYGAYAIRKSLIPNADTVIANSDYAAIISNATSYTKGTEVSVHEPDNRAVFRAEVLGSMALSFRYRENIYTYEMDDPIVYFVWYVDDSGLHYTKIREESIMARVKKNMNSDAFSEAERAVYTKMSQLYDNLVAHRGTGVTDIPTTELFTVGQSSLQLSSVSENPYEFLNGQQIILVEPWGIRINALVKKDGNVVDYSALEDYGIVFYHAKDDAIPASVEEMLSKKNDAYVFAKEHGNAFLSVVNGTNAFSARYRNEIYTYELDSTLCYCAYIKVNGEYYYSTVWSKNIKELAAERSISTSTAYSETEKAVYSAMVELCEVVVAYRSND